MNTTHPLKSLHLWHLDTHDLRFGALLTAILVYGLWGTPTPDHPGRPELWIGLLLVCAVGMRDALHILSPGGKERWHKAGTLLLLYGLSFPLLAGLAYGNNVTGIIRDIIPFLFLLMPLFLFPLATRKTEYVIPLTIAAALVGLLFSFRVLEPALSPPGDPFYLANAPTVLFAALLLTGSAGRLLYFRMKARTLLQATGYAVLSFFPLAAMALVMQRASLGIVCLSALFLAVLVFIHRPVKSLPVLIVLAALIWWSGPILQDVGQDLLEKNTTVGLNMRWQEAAAVMNELDDSVLSVLFGKGWGATVASPAVGGVTVNFTHSLITTYWLKTGLCGLILALVWLYSLALRLLPILRIRPVMALALAGPLAIDVLLYASFKSLDFGLILLLIPLWADTNSSSKDDKLRSNATQASRSHAGLPSQTSP